MDIFKFTNPNEPTLMEQAELIDGFTSKLWIERYQEAGEFTLISPVTLGHKELLPAGTFISHVDSKEIMIVENHEINDDKGSESKLIITGRGLETFLENRIVGSNKTFPLSGTIVNYTITPTYTWHQIVAMIEDHIVLSELSDGDDEFPYVEVLTTVPALDTGVSIERVIAIGSLYDRVLELLKVDNLGIKVIRPGPWSDASPNTALIVHKGVDRTKEVAFSYDTGEIENADYLWSNKKLKNAVLITGKWVETRIVPPNVGYERRWMHITANDLDDAYSEAPVSPDLDNILNAMHQRGIEALTKQKNIALTKAQVSQNVSRSSFRKDFDVGDIITVFGDYNEVSKMRVTEYVEIEDETGSNGYPTLTIDIEGE